ncbi:MULTISPECIES: DUF1491 family protein [Methylocystis]|uniref:DUF1491 family protein n=1 Tax=Methylocystis iwaonis TaxID=2885079 RepID=A0ABN6VDQ0_9HYPH|nr:MULTISPECIES: DUF1491 family protein [Methylocystis]MBL1258334.1 DUF1491 family protein [Methylocystis sp. Sn-Cys]MDJ0447169.1 DUF1491 family protein [Methylocystis sp. JR02]BDV33756.1 hypothetical protein SS37A_12850 [Methylocystis iwaonis]
MRLRSDIFVAALIRRAEVEGAVAMLRRRGAAEAGAVFIKLDRLDGRAAVYGPAPQSEAMPEGVDRLFSKVHKGDWVEPAEAEARLKREIMFDPDLWFIEIEDRDGRVFVELAA